MALRLSPLRKTCPRIVVENISGCSALATIRIRRKRIDLETRRSFLLWCEHGERVRGGVLDLGDPELVQKLVRDAVVGLAAPGDRAVDPGVVAFDLRERLADLVSIDRARFLQRLEQDLRGIVPARR